jgi:hypothetical protein
VVTVFRYAEELKETAKEMAELAEKLTAQKAQPLTKEQKQLVRLALLPRFRRTADELAALFVVGTYIDNDCGVLKLLEMSRDLSD